MDEDTFYAIKEWYHYGVTQLMNLHTFKEDYAYIASMLEISRLEAKMAVERLLRLDIIRRDNNGKFYRTATHFKTTNNTPSHALRFFQKQILEKAILSLEDHDIYERDITSITMAINEEKLEEVKLEIKKFRNRISEYLGEGEKTRVYNLGVHLIPLSKSTKKTQETGASDEY